MLCNKRLNQIVTELFIRGRKLNIPLVIIQRRYYYVNIIQFYFAVPKNIRLNPRHNFIIEIRNKQQLQ